MLHLGPISLGTHPCVALAIQQAESPDAIRAAGPGLVVELRLDAFSEQTPSAFTETVRGYAEFPLLGTIRRREEGGAWRGTEAERQRCYEAILPEVHAIDIEIEADEIAASVIARARQESRLAIASFHDFSETPSAARLEEIHTRGRQLGADIVKVAARCNTPGDLRRLAAFTLAHGDENVITIGMGDHGLVSRVFFPALGSLVTYTFLGAPTAPGQLNCADTLKYLGAFYPKGSG